ncbi:hypothetical protein M885DRAFT_516492 [Pelagophyceae sp. CCMP2097]|nr:hypothetical protein M885DRAFT_516492 [Pelagophyceae sp. CCMP2097]
MGAVVLHPEVVRPSLDDGGALRAASQLSERHRSLAPTIHGPLSRAGWRFRRRSTRRRGAPSRGGSTRRWTTKCSPTVASCSRSTSASRRSTTSPSPGHRPSSTPARCLARPPPGRSTEAARAADGYAQDRVARGHPGVAGGRREPRLPRPAAALCRL